ncbi:hypothetical protein B0H17DRAFT_1133423 [Mycena rosella]|uniref:Uncharacterized protein n=1 Tax=Mycena rosella TaxID=1033263 RepID=A0AAD7GJD4_MYCRO|nr:hypothetical protein B0H17DRAFT_1133423 [Mycena rosella]
MYRRRRNGKAMMSPFSGMGSSSKSMGIRASIRFGVICRMCRCVAHGASILYLVSWWKGKGMDIKRCWFQMLASSREGAVWNALTNSATVWLSGSLHSIHSRHNKERVFHETREDVELRRWGGDTPRNGNNQWLPGTATKESRGRFGALYIITCSGPTEARAQARVAGRAKCWARPKPYLSPTLGFKARPKPGLGLQAQTGTSLIRNLECREAGINGCKTPAAIERGRALQGKLDVRTGLYLMQKSDCNYPPIPTPHSMVKLHLLQGSLLLSFLFPLAMASGTYALARWELFLIPMRANPPGDSELTTNVARLARHKGLKPLAEVYPRFLLAATPPPLAVYSLGSLGPLHRLPSIIARLSRLPTVLLRDRFYVGLTDSSSTLFAYLSVYDSAVRSNSVYAQMSTSISKAACAVLGDSGAYKYLYIELPNTLHFPYPAGGNWGATAQGYTANLLVNAVEVGVSHPVPIWRPQLMNRSRLFFRDQFLNTEWQSAARKWPQS